MDFTFKTTVEDLYIHIEFQTTNSYEKKNLRRFHSYEALFSHNTNAKVITYVIYTGDIEKTKGELDCGIYTYRVIPIYMGQKNADGIIQKLKRKHTTGEGLTEEDFAQLSIAPLMGGTMSRKDKIKEGILLAKEEHNDMANKVIAMLYTLADKFLEGIDLDEIREAIAMTRLGQMLVDDGIKIGEVRGREEAQRKMNSLINALLTANRTEDCLRATQDADYREKLMRELGIN